MKPSGAEQLGLKGVAEFEAEEWVLQQHRRALEESDVAGQRDELVGIDGRRRQPVMTQDGSGVVSVRRQRFQDRREQIGADGWLQVVTPREAGDVAVPRISCRE